MIGGDVRGLPLLPGGVRGRSCSSQGRCMGDLQLNICRTLSSLVFLPALVCQAPAFPSAAVWGCCPVAGPIISLLMRVCGLQWASQSTTTGEPLRVAACGHTMCCCGIGMLAVCNHPISVLCRLTAGVAASKSGIGVVAESDAVWSGASAEG